MEKPEKYINKHFERDILEGYTIEMSYSDLINYIDSFVMDSKICKSDIGKINIVCGVGYGENMTVSLTYDYQVANPYYDEQLARYNDFQKKEIENQQERSRRQKAIEESQDFKKQMKLRNSQERLAKKMAELPAELLVDILKNKLNQNKE